MTFKWTYLLVAAVVLVAVAAPALTGGVWGSVSYAQGVALILLGGFLIYLVRRTPPRGQTGGALREAAEHTGPEVVPPFVGYPKDHALAIFDSEDDAWRATDALKSAGYAEVDRYAGVAGAIGLDSQGDAHGVAASTERAIEHVASDVSDLEGYDEAVRAGSIVLGVLVVDGNRRHHVAGIMHRHRGHDVRYFGSLAAESLTVDPTRIRAD